jgi:hypothetical protein
MAPTTIALDPSSREWQQRLVYKFGGVTVSATDPDDSIAQTRCVLDPVSAPASFDELPNSACG